MNRTHAWWLVAAVLAVSVLTLAGCGGEGEEAAGDGGTEVAITPPVDDQPPEPEAPKTGGQPMAPPGEQPMAPPGGGPRGPGGPGGPGGPPPAQSAEGMEADIFGPAGFPRLPGLGRPDAMEFEGDDTGGTLHTEVGGQPTDMTYTPTDVTPTDVGFTMPEAAEAYSAYEFEGTVPEEAAQQMLTDAAERTGGDPPGDDPIPEEDLKSTITLVVYTMEGSFEEVQAALREACGDTVMAMGPVMVSTEVQGAMATLTPVEGQELVQISIVKMEAPKALESLLPGGGGVRMGQPGGMLRRGPRGPGGPGGPGRPGGPRGPGPGGPGQDG